MKLFTDLLADMKHYPSAPWWKHEGFWASAVYRLGHHAHEVKSLPIKSVLLSAYKVSVIPWRVIKNVSIPAKTEIGPGLCLHHPHNIIMPPTVKLGSNVTIYHEVTFGRGPVAGVPTIGNNVIIYAGAKILGGITVGDNVEIGANAVVLRDVPSGSVVAAPAARPIPKETREVIRASNPNHGALSSSASANQAPESRASDFPPYSKGH